MSIQSEIRSFIVETLLFGDEAADFGDDTSFLHEGIVDSMGVVELVTYVEERFGIAVESDEIVPANFDSVGQLAAYVSRKLP